MRLSHVSTFWREVVHGMPQLWQLIRLLDRQSISVSKSLLKHFSRLSGCLPLTTEIDQSTTDRFDMDFPLLGWMLTMWQDRNRLHNLGISTDAQKYLLQELIYLPNVNHSLRTFRYQRPANTNIWFSKADVSDVSTLLDRFPELTALWVSIPRNMPSAFLWCAFSTFNI
ncbi:hypothetical protein BJ165DRAFT_1491699 [Panaeolus papilionaceus]|nr:hypothetical protein BJ165DRAFT_1491699 [Panaeolus papilionaceus]